MGDIAVENTLLRKWLQSVIALAQPQDVHLVDGSEGEYRTLTEKLIRSETVAPLNPKFRPNSFLARSSPEDVARVEDRTFICSLKKEDAGFTNNWEEPEAMKQRLRGLFSGCMRGRTLYVVPFCMGRLGSPYARMAVQITDSPYVVLNMRIMTTIGKAVLDALGQQSFVTCLHSVGSPLAEGAHDVPWPCNPKEIVIAHFPESREVWSFGSGYGGNALLNKKCFALRIASKMALEEGWLAEHMLIISVTNPEGVKRYFAASFPSACGKTNLAMLTSTLAGWKVACVGDDIAWMHWGTDGRLWAINPEAGFFGVAPGTSLRSNPAAMTTIEKNTIFTNVALTPDGNVWWEGMTDTPPEHLIDWRGKPWTPGSGEKAAHPNARFTASVSQCPVLDAKWDDSLGVPISGIIFGGRRSTTVPLVRQAVSWQHGVFLGASMTSETTAAAKGELGKVRHDPFAMLPFCGYNMADYFGHWLHQERPGRKLPAIFYVNWFRKDREGNFLWPGFGENMRVLKWMCERIEGTQQAEKTPIGYLPRSGGIDLTSLSLPDAVYKELFAIHASEWKQEVDGLKEYLSLFGARLPRPVQQELEQLECTFFA